MGAAALAALSSPRPVLAACRTHPCPVPSSLVSAPETLALPVSFGAWGTDCPRPPSMHHRHPPEYRDTPACPRSGYCWAAPQRQLNLHTRTWRTITDFDPGCSSALRRVAEAPITISGSLFMTLCEPLDMSFGKTGTAKQRCCMLCLECASVWTQQLLLRAVSGRVQSRPAPQSSLAHFRIFWLGERVPKWVLSCFFSGDQRSTDVPPYRTLRPPPRPFRSVVSGHTPHAKPKLHPSRSESVARSTSSRASQVVHNMHPRYRRPPCLLLCDVSIGQTSGRTLLREGLAETGLGHGQEESKI